jgi:UDP-N-acetylmuramoyl-L-alanyl-D-glutamate--2,6-diaminopimelate ligase
MKNLLSICDSLSSEKNVIGLLDKYVSGVEYDSRKCEPGSCFVAIKGLVFDGHDYIKQAIRFGAKTIICESFPKQDLISPDVTFIIVNDSRLALAEVSHAFFDFPSTKLNIIGITGTDGKTTISFLLNSIFNAANSKGGIIGTTGAYYNHHFIPLVNTTPESRDIAEILHKMLKEGVEWVAIEISSHALNQKRTECINFRGAIFTNLSHDHLDYHESIEEYAISKKILFDKLDKNAIAVVFGDDEYAELIVRDTAAKVYTVGRNKKNYYKILKETAGIISTDFVLYGGERIIDGKTALLGKFNIENAALAAAVCNSLKIEYGAIQKGLSVAKGAPGRMQKVVLFNEAVALVDYAHTPDALEKAINACKDVIKSESNNSKMICVFGCGGDRDRSKRPVMGKIASESCDIVIITSDNPRSESPENIIKQILAGTTKATSQIIVDPDRKKAIEKAVELSSQGDIILIAGKGHEKYQIIGTTKHDFDDVAEIEKFGKL